MDIKKTKLKELNVCWNSVYRKIVRYNKWESVKALIYHLGLDLWHIVNIRILHFIKRLLYCTNRIMSVIMYHYIHGRELKELEDNYGISINSTFFEIKTLVYQSFEHNLLQ